MPDVTSVDKSLAKDEWGPGLWLTEPDVVSLTDSVTSYPILLNRHPIGGYWCGYVGVPVSHVVHGISDVRRIAVGAPGGLTYAGPNAAGTGSDWWIGFTGGAPAGSQPGNGVPGVYVTVQAVRAQALQLAYDLARIDAIDTLPSVAPVPVTPTVPTTSTSTTVAGVTVSAGTTSSSASVGAGGSAVTGAGVTVSTGTTSSATNAAASAASGSTPTVTASPTTSAATAPVTSAASSTTSAVTAAAAGAKLPA